MKLPRIVVLAKRDQRVRHGHPWIFSNEIQMDTNAKAIEAGSLVRVQTEGGETLGIATFNPHTLIAARLLTRDVAVMVDQSWLEQRIAAAQSLRLRLYDKPYYRLIHAEADGFGGLIVDRYGDVLSVQANTAGMDKLLPQLIPALQKVTGATVVVLNRHGVAVKHEGLTDQAEVVAGALSGSVSILENEAHYAVDPVAGQKTGWFYDQRENRAFVAQFAAGKTVFDGYCYAGGFGVLAAVKGAKSVEFVDQSQGALDLAAVAAKANDVAGRCCFVKADVMEQLERHVADGTRFDVVIVDPPAFIKAKKDMAAGLKGYRKLARLAASVVAPNGILAICTCSYHAEATEWSAEVARGMDEAKREARMLSMAGAGPDHPVHPQLPESAYLKCQVFAVD